MEWLFVVVAILLSPFSSTFSICIESRQSISISYSSILSTCLRLLFVATHSNVKAIQIVCSLLLEFECDVPAFQLGPCVITWQSWHLTLYLTLSLFSDQTVIVVISLHKRPFESDLRDLFIFQTTFTLPAFNVSYRFCRCCLTVKLASIVQCHTS